MSKIDLNDISTMQYDVLKELGNIGAGNATTALSKLVNAKIDIGVPNVRLCDFTEISGALGPEEEVVAGILLMLKGDVSGMMMFILETEVARKLIGMLGLPAEDTDFDEMELSAIQEVGNIIAGEETTTFAPFTFNLTASPSVKSNTSSFTTLKES